MVTRQIKTNLISKRSLFRMLALAEATKLPVLFVGPPGVGKSAAIRDYYTAPVVDAEGNVTSCDLDCIFHTQTHVDSRVSDILGGIDKAQFLENKKVTFYSALAEAEVVDIDEIDKAPSGIKNALLSAANEKVVTFGPTKIQCNWKLFVASCNNMSKDPQEAAFWDRFILRWNVNSISITDMITYFKQGGKNAEFDEHVVVPDEFDIQAKIEAIDERMLDAFIDVTYRELSNRTMTFVPKIVAAISYIWKCSLRKAFVVAADILVGSNAAKALGNKIKSNHIKEIENLIQDLSASSDLNECKTKVQRIESKIDRYLEESKITREEAIELIDTTQKMRDNFVELNQQSQDSSAKYF
jgi:MoxR-like ATPase